MRIMSDLEDTVAVVWGGGGLGCALAKELASRGGHSSTVLVARRPVNMDLGGVKVLQADIFKQGEVDGIVEVLRSLGQPVTVISAIGLLHSGELQPEKSLRQLDAENLRSVLDVNVVAPSMLARHFLPLMPRKRRTVFAALSARVGSISDNRLGGWYAYRASKAALNMMLRTISIEWRRTNPDAVCLGLHPGTVDTELSKPFQRGVPEEKLFTPQKSAAMLVDVVEQATAGQSGGVFDYAGKRVPE